ncbi:hypothetical protein OG216_46285 (plasmid) [Streptomycetaceae bacterium NBC_01309]
MTELLRSYPFSAPADVLAQVRLAHDLPRCAPDSATESDRRAAMLADSLRSGLLARVQLDLGDPRAAIAQADAALRLAVRARSVEAVARLRSLQSEAAHWAHWPHEALRYARLGVDAGATGTGFAMIKFVEARSHALLGDDNEAREALRAANKAVATAEPDALDAIGGHLGITEARRQYLEAEACVHIRDGARRAGECAIAAVRLFAVADPFTEKPDAGARIAPEAAAATAILALAYAREGYLDGVRATLDDLLPLETARRTAPVTLSAARIHAELRRPQWIRSRGVREMQEQIEGFCQVVAGSEASG